MSTTSPIGKAHSDANTSIYTPSFDEQKKCGYVNDLVDLGEKARSEWLREASLNMAFYRGNQWVDYSMRNQAIVSLPQDGYEVRITQNHIAPIVDGLNAHLTKQNPNWIVVPGTDDEDQDAARASKSLLESVWHDVNMSSKIDDASKNAIITGLGVFRVGYAPPDAYAQEDEGPEHESGAGDKAEDKAEGEIEDKPGVPDTEDIEESSGKVTVDCVSPFSVIFDPGTTDKDLSSCRWIAEIRYLHLDELRDIYPVKGRRIPPSAANYTVTDSYSESSLSTIRSDSTNTTDQSLDRVRVVYYYERPSKRFPKGLCRVVSGNVLLEEHKELPLRCLPYAVIRTYDIPGKFAGAGIVSRLRGLQAKINHNISKHQEMLDIIANPKWGVEEGSISINSLDNTPSEVLTVATGKAFPRPIEAPTIPPSIMQTVAADVQTLYSLSGLTDLASLSGQSGRALQFITELEATKLGGISKQLESAMAKVGSLILKVWKEYMPVEVTITAVGGEGRLTALRFHQSELRNTDVRVAVGSMSIRHPSVQREEITMYAERGFFGDIKDPKVQTKVLKALEFGSLDEAEGNANNSEASYAREENYVISHGGTSKALPFENHTVHITEHEAMIRSVAFRQLPPMVFEAAIKHLAEHYMWSTPGNAEGWWTRFIDPALLPQKPPAPEGGEPPTEGPSAPLVGAPPPIPTSMGMPTDTAPAAAPIEADAFGDQG